MPQGQYSIGPPRELMRKAAQDATLADLDLRAAAVRDDRNMPDWLKTQHINSINHQKAALRARAARTAQRELAAGGGQGGMG